MTYTTTTLGLQLAIPGTGQPFETTVVNANFGLLEAAVLADRSDIQEIQTQLTEGVIDGVDLADLKSKVDAMWARPEVIISATPVTIGSALSKIRFWKA